MTIVAVTGHRGAALAGADATLLRRRVAQLLGAVPTPRGETVQLRSALAEGADRLFAEEALSLQLGGLLATLPLPRADYERDFASPASVEQFRRLLARASVNEPPAAPPGARAAGYAAAGRRLLAGADLLLTIWDGQPARGAGGTGEVVEEAEESGLPRAWIHAAPPHLVALARPGEEWLPAAPEELGARVAALLRAPGGAP